MNIYNTEKQAQNAEGIIQGTDDENIFDNENDVVAAAEKYYPDGGVFVFCKNEKWLIGWTA